MFKLCRVYLEIKETLMSQEYVEPQFQSKRSCFHKVYENKIEQTWNSWKPAVNSLLAGFLPPSQDIAIASIIGGNRGFHVLFGVSLRALASSSLLPLVKEFYLSMMDSSCLNYWVRSSREEKRTMRSHVAFLFNRLTVIVLLAMLPNPARGRFW